MTALLIRAEDKNRWERRAPLVPGDVRRIIDKTGIHVYVENSEKRIFPAREYQHAGAKICSSMAPGTVIFGVKEIPEDKILKHKIYIFFSHTIKGQKENMPLLKKIMESGSTLIDYERFSDAKNRRIVFFGRYAGDAGAIDILSLLGEYWAAHGVETPLSMVKRAHEYASVDHAHTHLKTVGRAIQNIGFPTEIVPFTVGVLGYGNVSGGAQKIFDCLPTKRVVPGEIAALVKGSKVDSNTVYLTIFKEEDLVQTRSGTPFQLTEYYQYPERYKSSFEKYLPYFSLMLNAVYWEKRYPRFITWEGLKNLYQNNTSPKLCGIADITCDTHGSVACNVRSTNSDMPAYQVDPLTRTVRDGHTGDGIVVLAVDNLPCELPYDASTFFSGQLAPLVPNILNADYSAPLKASGLCPEVSKAVIVYNGRLTPDYTYLKNHM